MASIIPVTPALPGAVNATTSFAQTPSFLLDAGSYLRLLNQGAVLNFGAQSFVNRGTIFNDIDGGFAGVTRTAPNGTIRTVENSGTIVYRGLTAIANAVQVFDEITTLNNSGQIFALATGGYARAIQSFVPQFTASNSGLIAAYSATAAAIAFALPNGGNIVNGASGRILAEGDTAVAVRIDISALSGIELDNAGLVEGRSITAGKLGVGVIIAFGDIVNSGTITGDIGIAGNAIITNRGFITGNQAAISIDEFSTINNEASGTITGTIFGGTRDDVINTAGVIDGSIAADGGDDRITITGSGRITGIVDLGLGDDRYTGGSGVDRVAGDNGDDVIDGQGGNDLMLGGNGNDTLTGGAGADGIYGEQGDDILRTLGADFASGGAGNDRIELGDYAFARIDGGVGTDTLVLTARAAPLDLTAALASGRIVGIERLALASGVELVVRAGDLTALSPSGSDARIDGVAGARIDLVGSWTNGGPVILDGVSYIRYVSSSGAVLVAEAATTTIMAAPPAGATGLDPVADGGPAPVPGAESGLDFTPDGLFVSNFEVFQPTTIAASDIWFTVGKAPAVFAQADSAVLTIEGALFATNNDQATVVAAQFLNGARIGVGTAGSIVAESYGLVENPLPPHFPISREGAYAVRDALAVTNQGYVSAYSARGVAVALGEFETAPPFDIIPRTYRAINSVPIVNNSGAIDALSGGSWAVGVVGSVDLTNSGSIAVSGALGAIGVIAAGQIVNSGTITATSGVGGSIGLLIQPGGTSVTLINSGSIIADTAIQMDFATSGNERVLTFTNEGFVRGNVVAGAAADVIVNRGSIVGTVSLGAGNDRFDGSGGSQSATVSGGAGNDILIGGNGNDVLEGGTGNDTLTGGAGVDRAIFAGTLADYSVSFAGDVVTIASAAQGSDTLTGIESFAFGATSYTLDGLRAALQPGVPPFYLLVPSGGSASVQGTGSVFGSSGTQEIVVRDVAGRVTFDGTFNTGGDRIVLTGNAANYTVVRSGASVTIADADTSIVVPVGIGGADIVFGDGVRSLSLDINAGVVRLGSQTIGSSATPVTAPAGTPVATGAVDPAAGSLLLVSPGVAATAIGKLGVFGSAQTSETITVATGATLTFDGSFNGGGDIIVLPGVTGFYAASRFGATVTITSRGVTVSIPAGTAGTTLRFEDGDRTLVIDLSVGAIKIGDVTIGGTPNPLGPIAAAFGADIASDSALAMTAPPSADFTTFIL